MTTLDPARHPAPPSIHEGAGKATKNASVDSQPEFSRWLLQDASETLHGSARPATEVEEVFPGVAISPSDTDASEEVMYAHQLRVEHLPTQLASETQQEVRASLSERAGERDALAGTIISPSCVEASEGILYEWQLRSHHSLSQFLARSSSAETTSHFSSIPVSTVKPPATFKGVGANYAVSIPAVAGGTRQIGSPLPVAMPTVSGPNDPASRQAVATLAGAIPSALWTERLLRTVEAADRSVTVWLRDYRLDEKQLSATVGEILRTHADGERIARVVINGNEVWRKYPLQSRSE